jgi:hypothetical protein
MVFAERGKGIHGKGTEAQRNGEHCSLRLGGEFLAARRWCSREGGAEKTSLALFSAPLRLGGKFSAAA